MLGSIFVVLARVQRSTPARYIETHHLWLHIMAMFSTLYKALDEAQNAAAELDRLVMQSDFPLSLGDQPSPNLPVEDNVDHDGKEVDAGRTEKGEDWNGPGPRGGKGEDWRGPGPWKGPRGP